MVDDASPDATFEILSRIAAADSRVVTRRLPGDTLGGATLSMARAIVRRAERCVVNLFDDEVVVNPDLQRYLNRLSSLCFVLELLENQYAGKKTSLAKS